MNKFCSLIAIALLLQFAGCAPKYSPTSSCGCAAVQESSEQDLIAHVGDRVFYNFNKASLSADANATLKRQAVWLAKYPNVNVLVSGNADERGTETYNLALGQHRADAAREYLLALGVSPARIQTISYGKDCPVATGDNDAAYQQNRNAITSVQGFNPQNCH
jgi:peptidoglycan-associated lipoprotein